MSNDRRRDDDAPTDAELEQATAEERAEAESLRQGLDDEHGATGSDALRSARLIASTAAPPLRELDRERVRKRILDAARGQGGAVPAEGTVVPMTPARERGRLYRILALAASLLIVAGTALGLLWQPRGSEGGPRIPYAQVFQKPFDREERPAARIARIIAWHKGASLSSASPPPSESEGSR